MSGGRTAKIRRAGIVIASAVIMLAAGRFGVLEGSDRQIVDLRASHSPRSVSGDVVFLAIDKKSLDSVEVWPWPREVYASLVDSLTSAGAREIFFDIDLSAPSRPEADEMFADALRRAGGGVLLPAFLQSAGAGDRSTGLASNRPLPMFLEQSWMASVNIFPDNDGVARRYPYGIEINGEEVPSVAAFLSGVLGPVGQTFAVNYSIMPSGIPTYPVIDVLNGVTDPAALEGKSVVVGAHATELRDNFNVPVHGILPGAIVQILATETLSQNVVPRRLNVTGPAILLAMILLITIYMGVIKRFRWRLLGLAVTGVAIEIAGFAMFSSAALVLPSAALQGSLLLIAAGFAIDELDLRKWLVLLAQIETGNSRRVLKRIFDDSSDGILVVDGTGIVLEASRNASTIFRRSDDSVVGCALSDVVPAQISEEVFSAISELRVGAWKDRGVRSLNLTSDADPRYIEFVVTPSRLSRLPGRSHSVNDDRIVASVTARDITVRHLQEIRLTELANFDTLTGALSRSAFLERLADFMDAATPEREHAVIVLNLHRFRDVNATVGRGVGDKLLVRVAECLASGDERLSDVARVGGDSFAMFARVEICEEEVDSIAERLVAALSEPCTLSGTVVRVGARAGVALGAPDIDASTLLSNAELALDEARRGGGRTIRHFDPVSVKIQDEARQIEMALWHAIENDELFLAYQPQLRLSDDRLIGAEALVRWQHPTLGFIPPDKFIGLAESNGFIEPLGRWVLERAARDAMSWPSSMTVAVNVSPVQLLRGDLVQDVRDVLARTGLDPDRLHLEITESIFVEGADTVIEMLQDIRMLGIRLALDDFGSGFSSFSYLARLPLDKIKLDRMFVQELEAHSSNPAIVRSVVNLARELELKLICEGIETEPQIDFLKDLGCDEGQGYFIARPLSQADFLAFARESSAA